MGHFKTIHLVLSDIQRIPGVKIMKINGADVISIPFDMTPTEDMKYLRDNYKYMIQTHIT